jgi:uncharacterized membrane protein YesL
MMKHISKRRIKVGRLFNMDNPFFRFMGKMVDVLWLNIIWLVFSLPIVTIGASTTAMICVMMKVVRDREGYIWRDFWKSFKINFKQSTIMWIGIILVYSVLGTDIYFFMNQTSAYSRLLLSFMIGVTLVVTCACIYIFPLQAQFENPIKQTVKNALIISMKHMPWTLLLLLILIGGGIGIYLFFALAMFFGFGLIAFVCAYIFNHIFIRYIPEDKRDDY